MEKDREKIGGRVETGHPQKGGTGQRGKRKKTLKKALAYQRIGKSLGKKPTI